MNCALSTVCARSTVYGGWISTRESGRYAWSLTLPALRRTGWHDSCVRLELTYENRWRWRRASADEGLGEGLGVTGGSYLMQGAPKKTSGRSRRWNAPLRATSSGLYISTY